MRRPPIPTLTATLFPSPTLFRSLRQRASRLPLPALPVARTARARLAAGAPRRVPRLRAAVPGTVRARPRARHRLRVRQPEHGRCLLRGAQGARPAGAADPPREVRFLEIALLPLPLRRQGEDGRGWPRFG